MKIPMLITKVSYQIDVEKQVQNNFPFMQSTTDRVTVALWMSFENADGSLPFWPKLKNLIYNGGLDPNLRPKVW